MTLGSRSLGSPAGPSHARDDGCFLPLGTSKGGEYDFLDGDVAAQWAATDLNCRPFSI